MISNDFGNKFLKNYLNRNNKNESAADVVNRLRTRGRDGQEGDAEAAPKAGDAAGAQRKDVNETGRRQAYQDIINTYTRSHGNGKKGGRDKVSENPNANPNSNSSAPKDGGKLSAEEQRQKEIAEILAKIEAEDAAKNGNNSYGDKHDKDKDKTSDASKGNASSSVTSTVEKPSDSGGVEGFLNEMPLFNEFKTSLMDAFKSMDSGTSGSIRAQYELNYTTMQTIAGAAGYEYEETSVNLKFDLSYVKAANGGTSGAEIAEALEGATDFASLMDALERVSSDPDFKGQLTTGGVPGATTPPADGETAGVDADKAAKDELLSQLKDMAKPDYSQLIPGLSQGNLTDSMKDYFSPENTAGRILDFATAFFPMSDAFKKGGDTEEARKEFADMMGKAVQKGFDQALGSLGKIPDETKAGIDKTHELVFQGFDDFVKNGLKEEKKDTYDALQDLMFSFEASVTKKKVSVSYAPDATASAVDAEA